MNPELNWTYFVLIHAQKWPLFFLKRGKKIPFLGYTRKMWELLIIPIRIINYSLLWGKNCVISLSSVIFCYSFGQKVAISVHAWEKIMYATREEYDDSHSCFCIFASLVRKFTLVRIILFLPCSINIYDASRQWAFSHWLSALQFSSVDVDFTRRKLVFNFKTRRDQSGIGCRGKRGR